jgi:AcrR family transcriptional regulator
MRLRESARDQVAFAILDAAESVFATEGLHTAKMGQIADAAGIAVGTLYNYFEDRDAILRALIERRGQELRDRVATACAARHASFADELRAVANAFAGSCVEHGRFFQIVMQAESSGAAAVARQTFLRTTMNEVYTRMADVMSHGIAAGALRAADPHLYARALSGLMRSALLSVDGVVTPAPTADEIVDLFLHGAAPR